MERSISRAGEIKYQDSEKSLNFYTITGELREANCDGSQSSESDFEYITEDSLIKAPARRHRHHVPCYNNCGEILDSTNHESHVSNDCKLAIIDCDFQHVGCEVRLPRKEMSAHLEESVVRHLSLQTAKYQDQLRTLRTENERLATKYEKLDTKYEELEKRVNELMFDKLANTCGSSISKGSRHANVKRKHSLDISTESHDLANRMQFLMPRPHSPKPPIPTQSKTKRKKVLSKAPKSDSEVYVDDGEYINADEFPEPEERDAKEEEYSYVLTRKLEPRGPSSKQLAPQSPTKLVMRNFEKHKKNGDHWMSQPFFTHPQGFMMCLRVTANGQGSGKSTHITVGVYLMKGEFDDQLHWPFRGDITIQLLNQDKGDEHFTKTIHEAQGERRRRDEIDEKFISAWGISQFKLHSELRPRFMKNDCLKFQIAVALVNKRSETLSSQIIQSVV